MHYKHALNTLWLALVLTSLLGMPVSVSADDYEQATAALADGDYRTASRGFKRLARDDHARAQYQLGMLYLFGKGVAMDTTKGLDWLKRAAGNGSYLAANELGQIYIAGRGVAPDEQEAMRWIELATRLAEESPGEADDGCD